MTCEPMNIGADPAVSATYTMYVDSTKAIKAKACKSTMRPSLADSTLTVTPYARTLNMTLNDFAGHETTEGFDAMGDYRFFTSWNATYLYLGWQGCGLNTLNPANADDANFALAYLGVPGLEGIAIPPGAFTVGTDLDAPGARWQLKYNVGANTVELRLYDLSGDEWELVTSPGITFVRGAGGGTATCTDTADKPDDYVIVRIPLATLVTSPMLAAPTQIAIAEGVNIGGTGPNTANEGGWPFTTAVFDKPAAIFDFTKWQSPTGATSACATSGIDGTPTCQYPLPPAP
jgi:hypothetical protein